MKGTIHQKEESVRARWRKLAEANGDAEDLCTDGLLYRGPISYREGCWHREPGNEEEQWAGAKRRLVILTKDLNDEEGWDIREETGRYNEMAFSYERAIAFYKNLRLWSYLMLKGEVGNMPAFKEARNMNLSGPFYETAPIVRVNCKKQVGKESIADAVLMRYLETYAEPLKEQLSLYDGNILYCCGCSCDKNLILDFVRSQCLTDLQLIPRTGGWMYYSPSTGKLVVNSYHPSARIGYEDTYCNLAEAYEAALKWIKANYGRDF